MAKFAKKILAALGGDLRSGETLEATVFTFPVGAITRRAAYGVGSVLGGAVAEKIVKRGGGVDAGSRAGLAARLPARQPLHLAVTSRRLIAFGAHPVTNQPTEVKAQHPLKDLDRAELTRKGLGHRMTLHFADGSSVQFVVARSAKPGPFVDTVTQLLA